MHQGGATCHSIILAAACPRGLGLCFHTHTCTSRGGNLKASFSPLNTRSQTYSRAENTLRHKSRLEHGKVICRQALLTHTPHMSGVICVQICRPLHTHIHYVCVYTYIENAHAQAHTVNTTNAFSSTNNNILHIQSFANVNICSVCLRYSGCATWLRQKLPGLTVFESIVVPNSAVNEARDTAFATVTNTMSGDDESNEKGECLNFQPESCARRRER